MKNLKALENIRNTIVGHILIDYRIACAMCNYSHKACNPDADKAKVIANTIKSKVKIVRNELKDILRIQLNTKSLIPIDLSKINDFPRL